MMSKTLKNVTTIPKFVDYFATRFEDNIAVVSEDGETLSYAELAQTVATVARAFIANGIVHGDRVAIWGPNNTQWIIAALGLQSAGAALVPMSTRLKGIEADYILRKSGAKILLTVNGFLGINFPALIKTQSLPELKKIILFETVGESNLQDWHNFISDADNVDEDQLKQRHSEIQGDHLADIMFTSGTTGKPKGVETTQSQNLITFANYSGVLGLRENDRYLIVNPFFHVFGYKAGWLSALIRGAAIYPQAILDVQNVLERIAQQKITILPGTPTLYQMLMSLPDYRRYDLSSLRLAITGGAAVPAELIRRMRGELGFDTVLTAYGLTETSGLVSMCSPEDSLETISTTAGKALPGVELRIVNDQMEDMPAGRQGELLVRGYNVMRGYFEDPDQTNKVITPDGWLHTGDEAKLDENGYLSITGRKKEMFIVGGFNCYPAEIENILMEHPAVAQVAVIGIADERMGEVAKAFIVLRPEAETVTPEDIIGWSRKMMSNYKVPREVVIRSELPTTPSGKIQKFLLK